MIRVVCYLNKALYLDTPGWTAVVSALCHYLPFLAAVLFDVSRGI